MTSSAFPCQASIGDQQFTIDLLKQGDSRLDELYRFRHHIFMKELGYHDYMDAEQASQIDVDKDVYDNYCDYVVVSLKSDNTIIACYRLMPISRLPGGLTPYTATEFDLTKILDKGLKLTEMGRAAIHADFRNGLVINLLWRGLARYITEHEVDYFIGLVSLKQSDPVELANKIYHYCQFRNGLLPDDFTATPLATHQVDGFSSAEMAFNPQQVKRELPSLLRAYLTIGTRLAAVPAFDHDFKVIDFFMAFRCQDLQQKRARFFN